MKRIYLDWNATAPLLAPVKQAMVEALEGLAGNASSIHREGQAARAVIERARRALAGAINAPMQAVVLTGGATESNNQVLHHHVRRAAAAGQQARVICTAIEHPSVLEVLGQLEREDHVQTAIWPVDSLGRLDLEWLRTELAVEDAASTLVSVMWANNEVGNIFDVAAIGEVVHEAGALLHVDGTQALGRIALDFAGPEIDYMTLSFHKMGGPKGIGAIVVREGLKVDALLAGGHQERGRRPGTENVPAAAGLEAAALALKEHGAHWNATLSAYRARFLEAVLEAVEGVEVRGDLDAQLPNTLNLAFAGLDGEDVLLALDLEGVAASSGSACTAGSLEPSHVLLAMGFEELEARRSVRFSFGPTTSPEELDEAVVRIARVVRRLRLL